MHIGNLHSGSTVQVRFRSLRAFYNWAEREEWIKLSPMHRMPLPRADKKLIPVPDTGDPHKLLAACPQDLGASTAKDRKRLQFESLRDIALLRLTADCGLRLAEFAGLKVEDLSLNADRVQVLKVCPAPLWPTATRPARHWRATSGLGAIPFT